MDQKQERHDDQSNDDGEEQERDLVEAYVAKHALEATLNDVMNRMMVTRPEDPCLMLSSLLYERATAKRGILFVQVEQVMDALGEPTVFVRLHTGKGVFEGCCAAEAGGITDHDYAKQSPNVDELGADVSISRRRYNGKGFVKIAASAQTLLTEKLVNQDPTDQKPLDIMLQDLETRLGRNVCLATSLALCQAGAKYLELPLRDYVSKLQGLLPANQRIPMPLFSIVNGGRYASTHLRIQEVMLMPTSATSFADALEIAVEFQSAFKARLDTLGVGFTNCGAFGGLTPQFQSLKDLFPVLRAAQDDLQVRLKDTTEHVLSPLRIDFGVDFAASEYAAPVRAESPDSSESPRSFTYNTDWWVPGSNPALKSSGELVDILHDSIKELELTTIVDPFDAGDIKSFATLHSTENDNVVAVEGVVHDEAGDGVKDVDGLGGDVDCRVQIVGRAVVERHELTAVSEAHACNTVLLVPHQFPTVSQLLQAISNAHNLGLVVILEAAAGQFGDAEVLVALAIGTGLGQVKFGGVLGAAAQDRYRKLVLESQEPGAPPFVGANAFRR